MQVLSAYLLESPTFSDAELQGRLDAVRHNMSTWLQSKGAADPSLNAGEFESLTKDGSGVFSREEQIVHLGALHEVRLEEFTRAGQIFTTHISAVAVAGRLRIYCTLSVANSASIVAPLPNDPRCPSIVRTLLDQFADWTLNGTTIGGTTPRSLAGETGGKELANEIRSGNRSLPIVVVSQIEGEQLWPRLAEELAFDLAGLAHVISIDDDATWTLSDEVGKLHSCYRGAVRLYWPPRNSPDGTFNSTVWTASVLLSNDRDGKGLNRLRSTLRRMLMSTAALSITPPVGIREVRDAVARGRIEELEARAAPNSEELAIARLYINENQDLKNTVEQLQSELARTAARADMAEHALSQLKAPEIQDPDETTTVSESTDPGSGEVRFYKKTHSKGAYDVLVEVADCGHTSWQGSAKADKARKGLEKVTGRNDWKSLQHCGTCTGGGMWKVRW